MTEAIVTLSLENKMKTLNFIAALLMVGCAHQEPQTIEPKPVAQEPQVQQRIPLYWENTTEPHPERAPWSDAITKHFGENMDLYSKAKDVTRVCPKFGGLTKDQQTKALGEFWVAVAYYESSFIPTQYSVDVGSKSDKGSWSVGLYQLSVNDAPNKLYKYSFTQLQLPLPNITLSLETLRRQVTKTGLFILPNRSESRYWAVILDGNKYSQVPKILARVKKNAPFCGG